MMLTITIPNSGTWNAVLHDPTNHSYVLLENFRVHPIDSNSLLTRRTVMCSRSAPPRLEVGTPVNVCTDDGNVPGVIAHTTAETSLVDPVSDTSLMYVRNDAITYRMGVTIDEDLPPCHVVDGYLVPCKEDRPVDPVRALKLSDVTTICSDMTLDAWVNKKLIDIVTYRKREFATKPWVPESHENPTGSWRILIGAEYIHETHPDGDVGTSPITVTTNVLENLQINSCVPLYEIPANVELPCENNTTIVTGVGTHFLMQFAFVTVFAVDNIDDEEEHLVRSPPSETVDMAATTVVNWGFQDALDLLASTSGTMDPVVDCPRLHNDITASFLPHTVSNAPPYTSALKSGNQTHETQLPKTLLDAMEPHLRSRRLSGKYEADGQARYVNVRPFVGRQSKTPVFRGYQVQLNLCDKRNVFLGNYARTTVGAIVATAAYMDAAFVHTSDGAAAWLDNMISDPCTASAWVDAVLANKFPPLIRRVS